MIVEFYLVTKHFQLEALIFESFVHRMQYLLLNAYDRHKMLVNEYLLSYAGSADKVLKRDTSKDKTDMDVIRDNHKVNITFSNNHLLKCNLIVLRILKIVQKKFWIIASHSK